MTKEKKNINARIPVESVDPIEKGVVELSTDLVNQNPSEKKKNIITSVNSKLIS